MNLGLVLLRQGRLTEAEATLEKALRLSPDHSRAHCYLGLVLYRRGDLARARNHFLEGEAYDFASKVEKRMSRPAESEPSRAEQIRRVAEDGEAGLAKDGAFLGLDAERDERVVRDEGGWQSSVSHSQPPSSLPPSSDLPIPDPVDDTLDIIIEVNEPKLDMRRVMPTTDLPEAMIYGEAPASTQRRLEVAAPRDLDRPRSDGVHRRPGPRARLEIASAAYLKPSTIVAASGRLSMSEAKRHFNSRSTGGIFGEPTDPMYRVEGRAVLLLRVARVAVALRGARDLHVVQSSLVGFDDGFTWDNSRILGLDVVTLRGKGSLLLETGGPPLLMSVDDETPVHAALEALLAWSDGVRPSPVETQPERPRLFKLFGRGYVLVQMPPDEAARLARSI